MVPSEYFVEIPTLSGSKYSVNLLIGGRAFSRQRRMFRTIIPSVQFDGVLRVGSVQVPGGSGLQNSQKTGHRSGSWQPCLLVT
jgi:hypothetical protein